MVAKTMDQLVSLCKRRGFIFQNADIYGGQQGVYDYGPLGVELKNNLKAAWWRSMVYERDDIEGLDAAILTNRKVLHYSGHEDTFSDPMVDCRKCKGRFRADHIPDGKCPNCGSTDLTEPRPFNLMFKTTVGPVDNAENIAYLRPETAQAIFTQFKNVVDSTSRKLPFGIAQIGKSFRNEITPGNFIFRTREFEQMELEFFCEPGTELEWYDYWRSYCYNFLRSLGMSEERLRRREHSPEELCHYSNGTTDIEYRFPFGWGELWGVASRTDYDLKAHAEHSGKSMEYMDPFTNARYIPYCIEPSVGAGRMALAFLCDCYDEETLENGDVRNVLHLHPALAPYKAAVLPLQKKLGDKAKDLYAMLSKHFMVDYDETGAIGKRYRRQDEIGTPLCITVDFETVEGDPANDMQKDTVTVRDRDTMQQIRLPIDQLVPYIEKKIEF